VEDVQAIVAAPSIYTCIISPVDETLAAQAIAAVPFWIRSLAALTDAAQAMVAAPFVKPSSAPADPMGAADMGVKPSMR